jgi:hypothetical protein
MFILGAYAGNKLPKVEKSLVEDINASRAVRGMSPLVGTAAWVRYSETENSQ